MGKIAIGIVGVGNCASSLLQGIEFYRAGDGAPVGLMHEDVCGYRPVDCCVPNPDDPETEDALLAKARRIHPDREIAADFPSRFRKK